MRTMTRDEWDAYAGAEPLDGETSPRIGKGLLLLDGVEYHADVVVALEDADRGRVEVNAVGDKGEVYRWAKLYDLDQVVDGSPQVESDRRVRNEQLGEMRALGMLLERARWLDSGILDSLLVRME